VCLSVLIVILCGLPVSRARLSRGGKASRIIFAYVVTFDPHEVSFLLDLIDIQLGV